MYCNSHSVSEQINRSFINLLLVNGLKYYINNYIVLCMLFSVIKDS